MQKIGTILLIVLIIITTACQPTNDNNTANSDMHIELIIGISGIDDKSFNQNAWEAIQKFAKEKGIPSTNYSFRHSMKEEDFVTNLAICADKKPNVIVAPGYYFAEPIETISKKYPDQKFILLDAKSDTPNVASITFASNEGSFLAGIAAALKADADGKDTVGFLGGIDLPIINEFEAGYTYGVHTINPNIKVLSTYSNDFANPIAGKKLASDLFDKGVYIIYNVAGDTGNGSIEEAKKRTQNGDHVWVIGVDKDQYNDGIYGDGNSIILTSMLKRVDVVTYDMLCKVVNGNFTGDHTLYSLKDNGVGIPNNNPNLTKEWEATIKLYQDKVISGEIIVPNQLEDVE